jgi:hypothetical protein
MPVFEVTRGLESPFKKLGAVLETECGLIVLNVIER